MSLKKWNKGDLVYIPSATNLKRLEANTETGMSSVLEYMTLRNPVTLLVASSAENGYEVVYQGSKWLVEEKDTYPVPTKIAKQTGGASGLTHCQIC